MVVHGPRRPTPTPTPATASAWFNDRGLPLEDLEFMQFHPTGLHPIGILISEAARGEGGILRNADGERFMERYAPKIKDLAPRDMVSRAIMIEILEGRGVEGKDYLHLDLSHLDPKILDQKLPEITGFARAFLGIEPKVDPIPVCADRSLCHGWNSHEYPRPGDSQRTERRHRRFLFGRRGGLCFGAWRQPAGNQLAARYGGFRASRRKAHARGGAGTRMAAATQRCR